MSMDRQRDRERERERDKIVFPLGSRPSESLSLMGGERVHRGFIGPESANVGGGTDPSPTTRRYLCNK